MQRRDLDTLGPILGQDACDVPQAGTWLENGIAFSNLCQFQEFTCDRFGCRIELMTRREYIRS